jgi:S1-C subfamily serine protease
VITAIDGQPVFSFSDLISYLVSEVGVGDQIVLTVLRDGVPLDLSLILEPRP